MKKLLAILLVFVMLFAFAGCGQKSDFEEIQDKGEMTIGITYFAPMNYEQDGELIGFETEFAKAVCEKLGIKANFQEINWDSKEVELNSKNIDCIWNGMTITPERAENMSISVPYMQNKQVMVVKAENKDKYKDAVTGATIVAEAGSAGEELAKSDKLFADGEFTAVDSQAKALMDVASGTSDIALVDYVTSIGSIGEGTDYDNLVVVEGKDFSPEEYGIAFRKDSDLTEKVNGAIKELAQEGKLDEIAAKYKLDELILIK